MTILGPDGKTPIKSEVPVKRFSAGGFAFDAPMEPDQLLGKALNMSRQAIGAQAYQAAMQRTQSAVAAQTEANTAAMNVGDPFMIEPAAMAVFMYLSREVEYRDRVIAEINKRLEALGAAPVEVEHPYPPPPMPNFEEVVKEAEEAKAAAEEDADVAGGDADGDGSGDDGEAPN